MRDKFKLSTDSIMTIGEFIQTEQGQEWVDALKGDGYYPGNKYYLAHPEELDKHINHKIYKGIVFNPNTPDSLIRVLYELYRFKSRITLDYGDTETGRSWEEQYDITGRIGKTTGWLPCFILVYNERSMGGGILLTDCILTIRPSNKRNRGGVIQWLSPEVRERLQPQNVWWCYVAPVLQELPKAA